MSDEHFENPEDLLGWKHGFSSRSQSVQRLADLYATAVSDTEDALRDAIEQGRSPEDIAELEAVVEFARAECATVGGVCRGLIAELDALAASGGETA